ncbi:MAG TPA: NrfD/PsrC family molybdoenzyme membrane anchor subunit [candidate division Zixibacteria bacterium]|nr:NrfD/PsrC family molybdoenzyme membrane anchor subunit [candidate division Zixibacteria bacterium]
MDAIVFLQEKWSHNPLVPLYLFLGGLAAGMFVVAAVADLVGIRSTRALAVSRIAAYGVIPVLALAGIFLTAHLGKPERGFGFPLFFTNYNSWMTWGGWVLGASAPLALLYAALWFFRVFPRLRRVVAVIGIPLLALLSTYTGFLLSGATYVPLWSPDHLPTLFLSSSLNTGLAGAGLLTLLAWPWLGLPELQPRPALRAIGVALLCFLALEGWELYRFMRDLSNDGLLAGHAGAPTNQRFQYKVEPGGALAPGTYVAVVTWVGQATGAEEGMSADTLIEISKPGSRLVIATPRRLGVAYNVYLGPSHPEAVQVAAGLGPKESVAIDSLPRTGLPLPLNLETGGEFLAPNGRRLAYRYVTGGPAYPSALFRGTAEAALAGAVSVAATPRVFYGLPHGRDLARWFWIGVVGLALALPIALTLIEFAAEPGGRTAANAVALVKFVSVLTGGAVLRFVVVWGGDIKAPLSFTPSTWPIPLPPPGLG